MSDEYQPFRLKQGFIGHPDGSPHNTFRSVPGLDDALFCDGLYEEFQKDDEDWTELDHAQGGKAERYAFSHSEQDGWTLTKLDECGHVSEGSDQRLPSE